MSTFGDLFDTNNTLWDKYIAMDMSKDSKFAVTSLASADAEAVDPNLRTILKIQLDATVKEHFELSDMLIERG